MDEKIKETMKGIYDNLSDELKEKAKKCKTMDELTALASKEGIELPDEVLDKVAGGRGKLFGSIDDWITPPMENPYHVA